MMDKKQVKHFRLCSAMLSRVLICCVELCWVMLGILSYV